MMPPMVVSGISLGFPRLSRCEGQIAHVLLTRSPLVYSRRSLTARLACVKHAASVRPEPGSNSPLKSVDTAPVRMRSRLLGVSRQEPSRVRTRPTVLPKEPSDEGGRIRLVDGALINSSSTFGTLLSSQGSCTHQLRTVRSCAGAPALTYRPPPTRSNLSPGWRASSLEVGRQTLRGAGGRLNPGRDTALLPGCACPVVGPATHRQGRCRHRVERRDRLCGHC
jgi:hypothetical protein